MSKSLDKQTFMPYTVYISERRLKDKKATGRRKSQTRGSWKDRLQDEG
jgi:hypothetical protein